MREVHLYEAPAGQPVVSGCHGCEHFLVELDDEAGEGFCDDLQQGAVSPARARTRSENRCGSGCRVVQVT